MTTIAPEPAAAADLTTPDLPPGWAWTTIGELSVHVTSGSRGWAKYYAEAGELFIRVGNLNRRGISIDLDDVVFVDTPSGAEATRTRLQQDDILLSITADVGMVGIVDQRTLQWGEAFINQHICLVRPGLSDLSPYLAYILMSEPTQDWIRSKQYGLTKTGLGLEDVKAIPIPLPPLAEQRRIVAAIETQLTRLDAGVASLRAAQARLRRYRAAVLKAACAGRLVAQDPGDEPAEALLRRILAERRERWVADLHAKGKNPATTSYEGPAALEVEGLAVLPSGWCWAAWRQVGYSQNGRSFPSEYYQPDGAKLLRPGNLHDSGCLSWTPENTRHMPESWAEEYPGFIIGPYELVMNLTAQSLKDDFLGRVCLTGPEERCLLNQRLARLTPIELDKNYLLWMFKSRVFRRYVDTLNTGSLIQHMFTSQLADFIFPLPPLAEQRRIVAEVERRLSVVSALEATVAANLRRAERLRQSILKRAFAGKLVPQDPRDEPASALLERVRGDREQGTGDRGSASKGGGRRGRNAVGAGLVPARDESDDLPPPKINGRHGRPRKDASAPTGRPLPASEPVRAAEQLGLEGLE